MTQPDWNPDAQGTKGIQLLDVGYTHNTIDAAADVGEVQWEADYTGDLDTVELLGNTTNSLLPSIYGNLGRPMLVELMNQGDEAWGNLTYNDFSVTAVTGSSGMYNENLTQPVTPSRLNGFNDGLFVASAAMNATLDCQFSTGSFGLDRHVLAVEPFFYGNITLRVGRFDPGGQLWAKDFPFWSSSLALGSARWGEAIVEAGASTWSHWTPSMVRQFASGGTRKVRITCRGGPGAWKLDRLYLRVWSIPERRRGVGIGIPTVGWVPFAMQTPAATGAPAIAAGDDLTLMARRITDYNVDNVAGSILSWRHLRGRSPDGNWRRHSQAFNPTVQPAANGTSLMPDAGPQIDGIPCARLLDGSTVIADSMPYSLSRGALVYGATTASQYLTFTGGATIYGQAFVVAGWVPTDGRPQAPLRAEVYDSGGTRVLDAVEVTADDVDRLPVSAPVNNTDDQGAVYKTVRLRFPDATTLSAAQYEVRLSSPESTEGRPWRVAALIADAHTTDQTFGGATDRAEGVALISQALIGLQETQLSDASRSSDLLVQLVEVPPPVTGTGTSVGSITAHHVEVCDRTSSCTGCADDTMPFVQVTWSPAPTGTPSPAGYQIDRMDDLSPDWERVAQVVGGDMDVWEDHEARIGVRSQYRIRVYRDDGVTGDWSDPVDVVIPTGQIALAFSSNFGVGLGCVYPEVWGGSETVRSWEFQEAGDVSFAAMFGRNRQVAFRPLERRGETFSRQLLLNAMCSVALPTMATFDPLRHLAWSPVPYVCVRDGEGNRWYAALQVGEGVNRRADAAGTELWLTEVQVTEVADRPSVVDTSVAQVTGPVTL